MHDITFLQTGATCLRGNEFAEGSQLPVAVAKVLQHQHGPHWTEGLLLF